MTIEVIENLENFLNNTDLKKNKFDLFNLFNYKYNYTLNTEEAIILINIIEERKKQL